MQGLVFLSKSRKGFFMMYEHGDIDWAAHAKIIYQVDDLFATMIDIDDGVAVIIARGLKTN
jgi:alkaline phosphatase